MLELEPPPQSPLPARTATSPAARLSRFWRAASPTARRLAGLLAASPVISLPVIRVVRQALLPEARQVHEAEVLLGDVLRVITPPGEAILDPDELRYEFRDGLRSLLLDAVPSADALTVLEEVSSYVEEHLDSGVDFHAVLADPGGAGGALVADESPFARVAADVLLRLGGDYARLVATLPPDGLALDDAAPDGGEAGFPSPPGRVGAAPPMQDPPSLSGAPSARSERFLSYQNKLSRIRKTRVHISYDVETVEAKVELELPFVMGVLGDFSGKPTRRLTPLRDRKFIQIDRDNFEAVMAGMTPGLEFRVANTLIGDGSELAMRLTFNSLEDFEPGGVVRQLEPLRKLCEARDNLRDLLTKVDRSDELENLLERIATSENDFKKLSEQLGVDSSKESESADGGSTVMIEDSPASLEKYLVQRRSSERHRHQAPQTALQASAAAEEGQDASLLEQVLTATKQTDRSRTQELMSTFVNQSQAGMVRFDKNVTRTIDAAIKAIDDKLSAQLSAIMHHSDFQNLEGTWRGLRYLVMNSETSDALKIKVLNVSKRELFNDFDKAVDFDQSQIFKKLYEDEFGTPGGQPYAALVGDFEFTNGPEDVELLGKLSNVAAAALSPFISAADPRLFGFESWYELAQPRDLEKIFMAIEYAKWRSFRDSEDSRFVSLVMPRVLARLPYGANTRPVEEFGFEELDSSKPVSHRHFTWMNTAYVMGARMTDAFAKYGLCTAIRGAEGGGKVEGLPAFIFTGDDGDKDLKCPTELGITDRREAELSRMGFLPLCHYKNTDYAVFMGGQTAHRPKKYDQPEATANAAIGRGFRTSWPLLGLPITSRSWPATRLDRSWRFPTSRIISTTG